MKHLAILILLACALPASAETITTLRGQKFYGCTVKQVHPDGISFTHRNGAAKILFTDLPASVRQQYGYSATKAAAYSKQITDARKEAEKARQEAAVRAAEEAEKAELEALKEQFQQNMQQLQFLAQMQPQGGPEWQKLYAMTVSPNSLICPPPLGAVHDGKDFSRGSLYGWDNLGIAPLVPGVGGVYVPPSGGHVFYPGVVPSLGYARPGYGVSATVRAGRVSGSIQVGGMRGSVIGRR